VQNVEVSFVREMLRRSVGIHGCNLGTEQAKAKRISFELTVTSWSSVIPSKVACQAVALCEGLEESLDYFEMSKEHERCLDFARHDNHLFFAVEVIRFPALDNDAVSR
jgi:hypothetical protein